MTISGCPFQSTPGVNRHEPKIEIHHFCNCRHQWRDHYDHHFVWLQSVGSCAGRRQYAATPLAPPTTVGTEIDDTIVTSRVKAALIANQEVKEFDIKVETRKGVVLLSGFVDSQMRIERVLTDTRAVAGVKGVENGMTLKEGRVTVGNSVDDSIVTTRVKTALLSEAGVKGIDIGVVTRKGKVQLSGFVDNQTQIDRAMSVTRAVEGVQSVVNEMSIKK